MSDATAGNVGTANGLTQLDRVFDLLPENIRASLSESQRGALQEALQKVSWQRDHAVNIRFSVPFLFRRMFVTIVAGVEKRAPQRVAHDNESHPLRTIGNFIFLGTMAILIYLIALAGVLAYSSIIEF
jgi:hypothetical protein